MDIQVYESVVRKYSPLLYRYCSYRLSYNHQLTEEAVNDTMRILFVKWDTLEINDDILNYLYRVADNCIKQAKGRDNKYYSLHCSLEEAVDYDEISESFYFDDYFCDQDAENKFIADLIESFPEEYKAIFTYRYLQKKTIMEIVELTNIPYSSIRVRLKKMEEYVKREVKNNY